MITMAVFASSRAQSPEPESGGASLGIMQGYVRDSSGKPAANAAVSLVLAAGTGIPARTALITHTDLQGAYRFAALRAGAYSLRAEMTGYGEVVVGPVSLAAKETKKIDLVVRAAPKGDEAQNTSGTLPTAKADVKAPEFYDEPQFTVAGATEATNSGGHGSDTVLRSTEALARATVSLSNESGAGPEPPSAATESSLREALARNPKDPVLHHRLGDVEEKLGNPLQAVREYQHAAELDASELYLFDWGTELLTHRALEPATTVFTKGNRLFPQSVRMLVALGVAWYARGSYEQAAQYLANASDLDPGNPTPYLFLGRMQSVETTPTEGTVERLGRFQQLQPENPLANYYYAVGLFKQSWNQPWKQSASAADAEQDNQRDVQHDSDHDDARSERVESLLQKAVHLDPKLGVAYVQLGILYSQRGDFSGAISAYEKAIKVISEEVSPQLVNPQLDETLEEAHYRLAQAYRRTGDKAKAQEQLQLHDQLSKKTKEDTERKRREIQEFVISLRNKDPIP
jgi:tetratricopeptide (TPR) repeat protein